MEPETGSSAQLRKPMVPHHKNHSNSGFFPTTAAAGSGWSLPGKKSCGAAEIPLDAPRIRVYRTPTVPA
jgi:hypothetical protein